MLRTHVTTYVENKIDYDDLDKIVAEILNLALTKKSTDILIKFFGEDASDHYLSDTDIEVWNTKFKNNEVDEFDFFYKQFNTAYLKLGFYYACRQGDALIARFFVEHYKVPGDLKAGASVTERQKYCTLAPLVGPPLRLAAASGSLDLVKFLYENTDAIVEENLEPLEETSLMAGIQSGNINLVEYLLEHGANPNSEVSSEKKTPFRFALKSKESKMIILLINHGVIITHEQVTETILAGFDIKTIEILLQHCLNRESYDSPYLLTAIKSGKLQLLGELETCTLVYPWEKITTLSEKPLEVCMIEAAAKSGNVAMMRFLADVKKIDLTKWVSLNNKEIDDYVTAHPRARRIEDIEDIYKIDSSIIFQAAASYENSISDDIDNIPLLIFLFEELNLTPSEAVIKAMCNMMISDSKVIAYLNSWLTLDSTKRRSTASASSLLLFNNSKGESETLEQSDSYQQKTMYQ